MSLTERCLNSAFYPGGTPISVFSRASSMSNGASRSRSATSTKNQPRLIPPGDTMNRNRIATALAAAGLLLTGVTACGSAPTATTPAPTVTVTQQAAPAPAPVEDAPEDGTPSVSDEQMLLNLTWGNMSADEKITVCEGWNTLDIKDEIIDEFYSVSGDIHPPRAQVLDFFDGKCA